MKFKVKKGESIVHKGSLVTFDKDTFETTDKDLIVLLQKSIVASEFTAADKKSDKESDKKDDESKDAPPAPPEK